MVDVKIFSRKGQEKDERAKFIEAQQIGACTRTWRTKSEFSPTSV